MYGVHCSLNQIIHSVQSGVVEHMDLKVNVDVTVTSR